MWSSLKGAKNKSTLGKGIRNVTFKEGSPDIFFVSQPDNSEIDENLNSGNIMKDLYINTPECLSNDNKASNISFVALEEFKNSAFNKEVDMVNSEAISGELDVQGNGNLDANKKFDNCFEIDVDQD